MNLYKAYGDRTVLDVDSIELRRGEKIGLVGRNGAGKSTFLAVLAGEASPDEGEIDARGVVSIVRQEQDRGGFGESLNRAAQRPGRAFSSSSLSENPSGGELTRAAIDAALAASPDILLADEPTTNLDINGVERLQAELAAFRGALVVVSHDRALLDAVCDEIWEIDDGNLRQFPGNYSAWLVQREHERNFAEFEYEEYRREENRLRESARKVKERARAGKVTRPPSRMSSSEARINPAKGSDAQASVAAKARATLKRVAMLEKKDRPKDLPEIKMALGISSPLTSGGAIRATGLSVSFGDRAIFEDAAFEVTTSKRTILLGPNGSGKTTLLGLIERGVPPVRVAPTAKIGYFDQNHESIDPNRTILQNARDISSLPEYEVRTILARLEIKGDDVHKECGVLSGGERAKVAFARLIASDLNTLVFDEPTNHIDLYTAEALESLLFAWRGTLLVATHDRRLIESIGERLLIIEDKKIRTYEGTWSEYLERR
ncbi:MAG: ATP-binding cassette domain-containing protein [Synergistaceae bacterium]|jgi:macrolide transport system ATP-binding/permease protein|nr:ATP-binding cassette domain-containing protein [Synergistaceae bacterium]